MLLKGVFEVDIFSRGSNIQRIRNGQTRVLRLTGQHRLEVPEAAGDEGGVVQGEIVVVVPGDKHLQGLGPGRLTVHHVLGDPRELCAECGQTGHSDWLSRVAHLYAGDQVIIDWDNNYK